MENCEWCGEPDATVVTEYGHFCSWDCHSCYSISIEQQSGSDYYIHYDDATEYDYPHPPATGG